MASVRIDENAPFVRSSQDDLLGNVQFNALGPLEVRVNDRAISLGGPKQIALLAWLLLRANRPIRSDSLRDELWPAGPPPSAAANLRTYATKLRRALTVETGQSRLLPGHRGYLLRTFPGEVDMVRFDEFADKGRSAMLQGDPESAARHLCSALGLWRGAAFDGLLLHGDLQFEASRLEEGRLDAVERLGEAWLAIGRHAEVVHLLEVEVARHPLREGMWANLMVALHRGGRSVEATECFDTASAMFRNELGLDLGSNLRTRRDAILARDPWLEDSRLPRAFAHSIRWPLCQLPAETGEFTGRATTIQQTTALLAESPEDQGGHVPLVVLTGLPGVGKSALAIRIAHQLRGQFPDGQLYVQLFGTSPCAQLPTTPLAELLRTLEVPERVIPQRAVDCAAMIRSILSGRRVLMVLDDAKDIAQVETLLPGIRGCAVIATSRSRLAGVAGSGLIEVEPFTADESRTLFGRLVDDNRLKSDEAAAERILAGCGDVPLALRIAGAKLASRPLLPLRAMADKLTDERLRLTELALGDLDVRGSMMSSYQQLNGETAAAACAIGMLSARDFSSWLPAAALDVGSADGYLETLVNASLLQVVGTDTFGQVRYRMHELVRLFMTERAAEPEADVVARALEAWLTLAEFAASRIAGDPSANEPPRPTIWKPSAVLSRYVAANADIWLEAERVNLVAAIEQGASQGLRRVTADLAAIMQVICRARGWRDTWDQITTIAADLR